jgi:hypothetical protein
MNDLLILTVCFALAFLTEAFVEYFVGQWFDKVEKLKPWKWLLMYVSAVVGVCLSIYYKLDLISLIMQTECTIVGMVLTGMAIGRGSNFLHQFVSQFFPQKNI